MPEQTFADLGVSPVVAGALAARGITSPFAIQRAAVPDVLAGRDVLAKSPTGSGKTLAFGVPLVERLDANGPRQTGLVLAPTRELALQIVEDLRDLAHARALKVAAVYGGAGLERQSRAARKAHLLVATPGRLEDLMGRGDVDLSAVRMLVLDEADRMLDMGFRPAVDRIVSATPRDRQTLFFSATLDGAVGTLAGRYTRDARTHEHAQPVQSRADVEHRFVAVHHEGKLDALVRELEGESRGRTLVFVRTKRGADRLVKRLRSHGVDAVAMHGDKTQGQREKALARFHAGTVDTLIATDVAARGIDVDDVTHVINFDAPGAREDYVHRVGRTGRAGRTGVGITFVMHDQADDVGRIADDLALRDEFHASGLRVTVRHAAPPAHHRPGAR
ncbi:MAG TPA: DEAD/DEAH box helicase, partial [Solirubrobacteraceae bacterium]|nr:DEAD/DEAH box helicase [Solirubrobacteraceae bacterium]